MIHKKFFTLCNKFTQRKILSLNQIKFPIKNFSLNLNLNFSHSTNSFQINPIKIKGKTDQNPQNEEIKNFLKNNQSKIKQIKNKMNSAIL